MALVNNNVMIVNYEDPGLEGDHIAFTCISNNSVLNRPNSSTCMGNEKWEPDPGMVNCTDVHMTTDATILRMYSLAVVILLSYPNKAIIHTFSLL